MPIQRDEPPLIVTAWLGAESFQVVDRLRRMHFPPALNRVPAHVSLFHSLPGESVNRMVGDVTALCAGLAPFDIEPAGLRSLGRGVAILYRSADLQSLRAGLAREWSAWLTPQDRQPFAPHITIQNKVTGDEARRLLVAMTATELPICRVEGVAIWRYLGGPWDAVAICRFESEAHHSGEMTAYGGTL